MPGVVRLTLVADPDSLLLEATLLKGIEECGFELLPFEDHVTFRFNVESRCRDCRVRGETTDLVVVLRAVASDLCSLPYDLLQVGPTALVQHQHHRPRALRMEAFLGRRGGVGGKVGYEKSLRSERNLARAERVVSHPKVRAVGLVVDAIDEIMHGMTLGSRGMHYYDGPVKHCAASSREQAARARAPRELVRGQRQGQKQRC